jgi:hypothetical protein
VEHPLSIRFSSLGSFSCINLHTNRDFDGGISGFHLFSIIFRLFFLLSYFHSF